VFASVGKRMQSREKNEMRSLTLAFLGVIGVGIIFWSIQEQMNPNQFAAGGLFDSVRVEDQKGLEWNHSAAAGTTNTVRTFTIKSTQKTANLCIDRIKAEGSLPRECDQVLDTLLGEQEAWKKEHGQKAMEMYTRYFSDL